MKQTLTVLSILLISIVTVIKGHALSPYQVSIRLYDSYSNVNNGDSYILCSGGIIHPYFVLTTAHCLHSHILAQGLGRPLSPSMVYFVAGNFSTKPLVVKFVNAIYIHNEYKYSTNENDIALLKLESPFDLKNDPDLQWLELPENSTKLTNCFFSFNNASATTGKYPYSPPQATAVADKWFCQKQYTNFSKEISENDICSEYYFSDHFMCMVSENQLKVSNDRGTPLICNNKLCGLLSVIIPPGNNTNVTTQACQSSLKTMAYYTRVSLYGHWIHSIIGVNLPPSADGKPAPIVPDSPPFQAPTSSTSRPPKNSATANYLSLTSQIILSLSVVTWIFVHHFII